MEELTSRTEPERNGWKKMLQLKEEKTYSPKTVPKYRSCEGEDDIA